MTWSTRSYHAQNRLVFRFLAPLLTLSVGIGCQEEPEPLPQVSFEIPQEFKRDGTTWKYQPTLLTADRDCLTKFFGQNRDLAGSPEFEGQPELFLSGDSDRLFYWLNATPDGVLWRCVEFQKSKFAASEGSGNPFLE